MTITLTKETFYAAVVLLLTILQIHQYFLISKLRKDHDSLYSQVQGMVLAIASALNTLEKKIDEKK